MRFDRDAAAAEGQDFLATLNNQPQVQDVSVCGSVRRLDPAVEDVDVLITAKAVHFQTIRDGVRDYGIAHGWERIESQNEYHVGLIMASGCPVEIRLTTSERRGAHLLWLTGSISFNVRLRKRAHNLGYSLRKHGLFDSTGALVAAGTEQDVFDALGIAATVPEERDR